MPASSFDEPQIAPLKFLVRCKSMLARQTLATTADRRSGLRRTGINHLVFKVSAFWASHGSNVIGELTTTYCGRLLPKYKRRFKRQLRGRFLTTDFTDYTDFFCEEMLRLGGAIHLRYLRLALFTTAFCFMRARERDSQTACIASGRST